MSLQSLTDMVRQTLFLFLSLSPCVPHSFFFLFYYFIIFSFFIGEITFYPHEVSIHFHFCLQSLKCDTLPSQTFKLWQFNPFSLFIPKMPPSLFFFSKKKEKIKKNMLEWSNHPIGGGRPPHLAWGGSATPRPAFWGRPNHSQWPTEWFGCPRPAGLGINRLNELNCHNLKV
jgi:hypothetical protein